ncbi:hypothetical protein Trydic_g21302 [Trypoxylus dichotomus]
MMYLKRYFLIKSRPKVPVRICKDAWEDIQEYKDDFKYVIRFRDEFRPQFLHQSPQGKFRRDAVNHIMHVVSETKLTHCSQQLAVYMLDIFMDNYYIDTDKLLLLANTCLLIAAKIEENSMTMPKIAELNSFVNNRYTISDYKNLEVLILNFYNWYVMFPTPAHYTHYYMQDAVNLEDIHFKRTTLRELVLELFTFTRKYLNAITEDIHYMQCFAPSKLGAAVLSSARLSIGLSSWTVELQNLTGYTDNDLRDIRNILLQ